MTKEKQRCIEKHVLGTDLSVPRSRFGGSLRHFSAVKLQGELSILQQLTGLQAQPRSQGPGESSPAPRTCGAPSKSAPSLSFCSRQTASLPLLTSPGSSSFRNEASATSYSNGDFSSPSPLFPAYVLQMEVQQGKPCVVLRGVSELILLLCSRTSKCFLF